MKTNLDIDDDVLKAAKEIALRDGSTVGHVISELARRALTIHTNRSIRACTVRNGVTLVHSRGEIVTFEHVQYLRGKLDF